MASLYSLDARIVVIGLVGVRDSFSFFDFIFIYLDASGKQAILVLFCI